MAIVQKLVEWTTQTFQPLGWWGLFILAFIESSFFPIPPDILLIILSLADPSKAWFYALICTIGSTLGGLFGYLIGHIGEAAVLRKMFSEEKIQGVHKYFHKYDAWAIFIAAFTPIPYKVFTIAAGVFHIELGRFTVASIIGRGMRFFIVAGLIYWKGQQMVDFIDKYFEIITIIVVLFVGLLYYGYKKFRK